jgi:activator of HSP90 ATPase
VKTKTIQQFATFNTTAHEVYEAIMDSRKHSELTGSQASITRQVGSKFSIYDGGIEGVNLELIPDKKIVQSWRYNNWPEGHYSIANFSLDEVDNVTHLTFTQTGVPEQFYDDIHQGWQDYYWTPMKELLER